MRPVPHRGLALLAIVAAIVGACDPEYALVVDNQGSEMVVVGRFLDASGRTTADVVIAPANSRTTIGSFGVGSTEKLFRIIVLTPRCEVVGDLPLSEPFTEGGTFTVGVTPRSPWYLAEIHRAAPTLSPLTNAGRPFKD